MSVMAARAMIIGGAVVALTFAGGCGSGGRNASPAVKVANAEQPARPPALAQFVNGIGVVSTGSPAPIWFEPGAVAALDGSAVFSIRHGASAGSDRLVRIDPKTGAVSS